MAPGNDGSTAPTGQPPAAPRMDPALLAQIEREQKAQAYVQSLPSISVRTSSNSESAGVGMDESLRLMIQQEAEMKQLAQMSQSQQLEFQQGLDEQQKFHELLKDQMQKISQRKAQFTAAGQIMLSVLTAPLMTMSTSLQLSNLNNTVTLASFKQSDQASRSFQARMAQLGGTQQEKTTSSRFNFTSLFRSSSSSEGLPKNAPNIKQASMSLPFKPPVYRNYFECFNGLQQQGSLGLYKGNGIRSLHVLLFHRLNHELNHFSEGAFPEVIRQIKQVQCAQEFLLACTVNLFLHPLHLAEARLILQNRMPNFAVYKKAHHVFTQSGAELLRGILMHVPRNFFLALSSLKVQNEITYFSMYSAALVTNLLAYPFLTVQRRLECRSQQATALFPNEAYKSGRFTACLSQIIKEEGARALWRGFTLHMLTVVVFLSALPTVTDFLLQRMPVTADPRNNFAGGQQPSRGPSEEEWYEQGSSTGADSSNPQEAGKAVNYVFDDDDDDDDYD